MIGRKSKNPRRPRRKTKGKKSKTNVPELASCSVRRSLTLGMTNTMYSFDGFSLADYDRASAIARNYQRYRIVGAKITFKPTFDTYSSVTAAWKPSLYYIIDKSGSLPDLVTLEGLKQMGARPIAFDEKPLTVTWSPSVLGESRANAGIPNAANYVVSPWLSTNGNPTAPGWVPSTISHQGLKVFIEQGGVVSTEFLMEVELQFEFKAALYLAVSAAVPAKKLQYAVLDASPDGVEGGADGITIPIL